MTSRTRTAALVGLMLGLTACSAARLEPAGVQRLASGTTTAGASGAASTVTSAPPLVGWRVVRTLQVPGQGPMLYTAGSLWVVDRKDGGFTAGRPNGDVYRIDPRAGRVIARVPHARGGYPAGGEGALWLVNAEFGETVTRVDVRTNAVMRFRTSRSEDPAPEAVAVTEGAVWVGNNHDGTVVKVDPRTLKVVGQVRIVPPGVGGVRGQATTDGRSVWMPSDDDHAIVRIDATTTRVVSRLQLPIVPHSSLPPEMTPADMSRPEWLGFVDGHLWASTYDHVYVIDVATAGKERIVEDIPIEGVFPVSVQEGAGAIWALTPSPTVLLRLDRTTHRVTGRLPISTLAFAVGQGPTLAVVDDHLWIRTPDHLLELGAPA